MTELVSHLESFLGRMSGGSQGDSSTPPGVQVAWFGPDSPAPGVTTLVTLGLSHHHLGGLHQELLMHLRTDTLPGNAAGVLFQVAGELLARGHGLRRGEVLGPRGRLFPAGDMTALIAERPVCLPDEFAVCQTSAAKVVLTWLVPITTEEAQLAAAQGWPALQEAFIVHDPDLADITRPVVV